MIPYPKTIEIAFGPKAMRTIRVVGTELSRQAVGAIQGPPGAGPQKTQQVVPLGQPAVPMFVPSW
jgi:hypothetical protein